MAQFATVASITGNGIVFAVNAQGVSRALKAGDTLQKGETVRTVGDVRVELLMEDGSLLAVAPAQSVRLDENVTESEQRPTAQDSAVTTPATAETIIQALERGADLSTELEAAAAGLTAGTGADGGNSFVQLLRITEGTDPLAYAYRFEAQEQLFIPENFSLSQPITETITITSEITSTISGVVTDTITGIVTDTVTGIVTETVTSEQTNTITGLVETVTIGTQTVNVETETVTVTQGTETVTGTTHPPTVPPFQPK